MKTAKKRNGVTQRMKDRLEETKGRKGRGKLEKSKGVRLRPDQIESVENLLNNDPEMKLSRIMRRGIDLFFAEQEGRIQLLVPTKQGPQPVTTVRSISGSLGRGV